MKYVVIDTETSGLFNFRLPADDPSQARLAHLHMILLDEDLQVERDYDAYVRPDGWVMEPGAQKVNGLSTEFLTERGRPVAEVLDDYVSVVEDGYVVVAYNAQFDTKVMRAELRRASRDDMFERTPNICVMRPCTDICRVPKKSGGFKFPKLQEACTHFGIDLENAHQAKDDARAAMEIFLKLHAMDALPEAKVHYAKKAPDRSASNTPEPSPTPAPRATAPVELPESF